MQRTTSRLLSVAGIVIAAATIATGCATAVPTPEASEDGAVRLAVLVAGATNAYQAAGVEGIKEQAESDGAEVTVFDAAFDANKQYSQLQTAITSGQFDGILINPVDGSGIVPLVQQAVDAGISIGAWNQPIGSDLTTPEPTVEGVTAQVMTPVARSGEVAGQLVLQACEQAAADPCQVAVLNFQKGSPYDTASDNALFGVLDTDDNVEVVVQADTGATREGGLAAVQTILAGHPDVNVIVGISQSVVGALPAIEAAAAPQGILVVGQALTRQGAEAVQAEELFGGSYSVPIQEGSLLAEQIIKAVRGEAFEVAIDPVQFLDSPCKDGVIISNVGDCEFQFDG